MCTNYPYTISLLHEYSQRVAVVTIFAVVSQRGTEPLPIIEQLTFLYQVIFLDQ